jgi:aminoglycoside phosphotransferase (APT) family kinase protein
MAASESPVKKVKDLHKVSDDFALSILKGVYPSETLAIEQRIDRAKAVVCIIDHGGQKEVLRLSASPHYSVQSIAHAYHEWESIGVPVPRIKKVGNQDAVQYLLMDYVSEPLFSFNIRRYTQLKIVSRMGGLLAQMRDVERKRFGYLDQNDEGISSTWNAWVKQRCHYGQLLGRSLNGKEIDVMDKIKDFDFSLNIGILLHGDYKPKNIFVAKNSDIAAITDPKPLIGDPLWDFATFNHFIYREQARRNESFNNRFFANLRDAFKQGYEGQLGRGLRDDELCRLSLYEILIDAGKVEKLLQGTLDEVKNESDFMLEYLKYKISAITI